MAAAAPCARSRRTPKRREGDAARPLRPLQPRARPKTRVLPEGAGTVLTQIDHFSIPVTDLMLAEAFYVDVMADILGGGLEDRKYLTTDDLELAAEGRGGRFDPPQSRVRVGRMTIALFLRHHHVPEPPPEQLRGTPRVAFRA